jgi:membrane-associated PAP2 superfamily phosphatase
MIHQNNHTLPQSLAGIAPVAGRFWRSHLTWPLAGFLIAFAALEGLGFDRALANAWSFNVHTGRWLGAGNGAWWARTLLHTGGRYLVRGVAAVAIIAWCLSFAVTALRPWRRAAGFVVLAMILSTGLVGALKAITNIDCPWDLAGFGGTHPYVALFADRPDALPRARCFPGAHSSSGFALVCLYFVLRDHSRRVAIFALRAAIAVGIAFSIGQEARGAHFLSHDLTSAAIVWFVQLAAYRAYARAATSSGRCIPQSTKSNVSMSWGSCTR